MYKIYECMKRIVALWLILFAIPFACKKDKQEISLPQLSTLAVSNITHNSASSGGNISGNGGATITASGICWSKTNQNPTTADSKTSGTTASGSFTAQMNNLEENTTYYVRAYATNSAGTAYGNAISFTTSKQVTTPTVTTTAVSNITHHSASSGGNITNNGGATVTSSGICWSKTNQNPTINDTKTTGNTASGNFSADMTSLEPNTTYYVRAYANNSAGTGYGNAITFTTSIQVTVPTLTTTAVSNITHNSASSGGNITANGGADITASGICWSKTNQEPTINDSKTSGTTASGSFSTDMTSLEPNTTYYVRAYATNSAGAGYGNAVTFTTGIQVTIPTITTTAISNITHNSATGGGNITANGGVDVTASGVCWSKTNQNPTTADSKTSGTTASGSFTAQLTSLEPNTTYYVRAYATNSAGTGYGNTVTFTTGIQITVPTITTTAISNVTHNGASGSGNISANGGATVTASGICWSKTNQNPTTADSKTSGTTATGSFTAQLTSLEPNTTYYVRAYATNSAGTGYGNTVSFTTTVQVTVPTLTTTTITNITQNSASSGGNITANGGATITASGICWSKTNNPPTTADSKTSGTTATGSFTAQLTSLEPNTTYNVRAYATNSAGTGYGNLFSFTTTAASSNEVTFTYNGETVTYGIITSPVTGKKWLDRNLGASRAATSSNDRLAYGHLFQWGRPVDGHQLINYSSSSSGSPVNGKTKTLATSDVPGHNLFITPDNTVEQNGVYVYDWRNDQNNNRWAIQPQGACPSGWHIPTKAEWDAETGITNLTTAFNQLKLTAAGYRYGDFDGSGREGTLRNVGAYAYYWSSSTWPSGNGFSSYIDIQSNAAQTDLAGRAYGMAVRCIHD